MRHLCALALVAGCGGKAAAPAAAPSAAEQPDFDPAPVLIPGTLEPDRAPDGNSVFLEAPRGLILVDTGRHPAHQEKLLAHARAAGKPIVAIVNTHWHLDHSGGNAEIRAAYPEAEIVTTTAIDGALVDFFPKGRQRTDEFLASGKATEQQREDITLDRGAQDAPDSLRPTRPVTESEKIDVGGRTLDVRVAPYAATEADVWIVEDATKTVIAGDLVVPIVPFFDTACAKGWQRALGEIAAVPFEVLIPGHGDPMTHGEFDRWRNAFDNLVACAASTADAAECVSGWQRDAAEFIHDGREAEVDEAVRYYIDAELRDAEAQRAQCGGGGGQT
jgi:glyoxylase-like metal-dependent hydrolase (beta-lactamase superfamily II)